MQANRITLTPAQETEMRDIITNTIKDFIYHPDNYDFIPLITQKIIAWAEEWFKGAREVSLQGEFKHAKSSRLTEIDKTILQKVWKIFKFELNFLELPPTHDIHHWETSDTFIPKGLVWQSSNDKQTKPYVITGSWYLGNPLICSVNQNAPAALSKELAAQAFKEECFSKVPTDFTITVTHNGTKTDFPVHKFILSCHSDVLRPLFENAQFKEAHEDEFEIIDFDAAIVKAMIDYCYTGKQDSTLTTPQVVNLAKLADKYKMRALLLSCEQKLSDSLQTKPDMLQVALELKLERLIPLCLQLAEQDETRIRTFLDLITSIIMPCSTSMPTSYPLQNSCTN